MSDVDFVAEREVEFLRQTNLELLALADRLQARIKVLEEQLDNILGSYAEFLTRSH
jgi:hypothetical protein